MEPTAGQTAGAAQTLGSRPMQRLARQWGRAPVRAAVLLRRPDLLAFDIYAVGLLSVSERIHLSPELRREPNAATMGLPDRQLLVMDQLEMLHLIGLKSSGVARLGHELMQWPLRDVTVTVQSGKGKFRAVEIISAETELVLAGPWKNRRQRAALELIEHETTVRF